MKPTQEQEKEFWERCGWLWKDSEIDDTKSHPRHIYYKVEAGWYSPPGQRFIELPPIDLNNLFQYAVPNFKQEYSGEALYKLLEHWSLEIALGGRGVPTETETADALFWALNTPTV